MTLFKNPFYLRSFIFLLCIDVSYTIIIYLISPQNYRFGHAEFISFTWFIFFYLLPVWSAASIIFYLRKIGKTHAFIELFIVIVCMAFGNFVVDLVLNYQMNYMKPMGIFVVLNGMVWAVMLYFFYMFFENIQRINQEKNAKKQAQLQTLRYQLNPHFMFNSLNTISAYIHSKPDVADQVLHNLADILRYSLDTAEKEKVNLSQELTMIDTYLAIEEARFGDRLTVNKNIEEGVLNSPIPPLLLQPIVENTIKHCSNQKKLILDINITQKADKLHIIMQDNGGGFSDEVLQKKHGKGIGLKNLVDRIDQLPNSSIILKNNPGACIEMELML